MNLEQQCVSLELAMRLKELGVKQKSLFYWVKVESENVYMYGIKYIVDMFDEKDEFKEIYSAFTASELMEMLPACIDTKKDHPLNDFWLQIYKRTCKDIRYIARYVCSSIPGEEIDNPFFQVISPAKAHDESLCDCLAKMLIHLIENKYIEIEKENTNGLV